MKVILLVVACLACLVSVESLKYDYVTWTSTVKLLNVNSNTRLHSHDVKYGSGSGQQSVTAVKGADDHNSYWQIRPKPNSSSPTDRGERIKCGDTVRMFHLATKRNLHSHLFMSPLSNNQEVSAFGDNGLGDDGDNWIVECDDTYWRRDNTIRFRHELTKKYLHVTGEQYGRPIQGQYEVSCYGYANSLNQWRVQEGIYIKQNVNQNVDSNQHTEL